MTWVLLSHGHHSPWVVGVIVATSLIGGIWKAWHDDEDDEENTQ